ncbi:hypothetical protein GOV12_07510, partial [Candidatus Pacearchaeota archaeon]|nr:hypothetical protein [Candidatus Pacearchaeota archaeon]
MRYIGILLIVCIMILSCVFLVVAESSMIIKDDDKDGYDYDEECDDYDSLVWQLLSGYQDLDKDSYGNGNLTEFCTGEFLPDGFSLNNLDCDDDDKNINPGVEDIINDGIDQDCDGFDRLDFDLDGYFRYDKNSSLKDCFDTISTIHPNAPETCNSLDDDCDGFIDEDYSGLNEECYVGVGECKVLGEMVCNSEGDGTFCRGTTNKPSNEICDSLDNDCDSEIDENGVCDFESYDIEIVSPNKAIYDSSRVVFEFFPSFRASEMSYVDHLDIRLREKRLCRNCFLVSRKIQFKEGFHNITLKAVIEGFTIEKNIAFFVDSKNPRISKFEFDEIGGILIKFTEDNPESLIIKYGNLLTGYSIFPIDIETFCNDKSRGRYE